MKCEVRNNNNAVSVGSFRHFIVINGVEVLSAICLHY